MEGGGGVQDVTFIDCGWGCEIAKSKSVKPKNGLSVHFVSGTHFCLFLAWRQAVVRISVTGSGPNFCDRQWSEFL